MATREEELALLGLLESQLGERQRAVHGMRIDAQTSLAAHADMLELQHQAAAARATAPSAHPRVPRHEWPGRLVLAIGSAMSLACVALIIMLTVGE